LTFDPSARIRAILDRLNNATYGLSALNADLDTLLARLTAARAGYLDDLQYIADLATPVTPVADSIAAELDELLSRTADP